MSRNTSPTPDQSGRWVVTKFGDPSVLAWQNCSFDRELGANEALVRVIAAGIAGPDNMQRVGGYPDPRTSSPGFTPGYDLVGEVIAVGSSPSLPSGITRGDIVVSMCVVRAHATHAILEDSELIRIDAKDDPIKVTALPLNYMTAWGMLKYSDVNLTPGSSILIGSASGGLGTAVAQLAQVFNLGLKMIGTCSPAKFDYLRSLGVTPIDRNAPDLVSQVHSLTGGLGVDVAYDAVGSDESLLNSYEAVKSETGKVVVVGVMSQINDDGKGLREGKIDFQGIIANKLPPRAIFFNLMWHYYLKVRDQFMEDFMAILGKVRSGELNPQICRVLPLRDAVEAHQALATGNNVKGKMVFAVDEALAAQYGL